MPVYEYECESCSHRFEVKQTFNDNAVITCPRCKSKAKRLFSSVPIIFKGTGFYATDNRGENTSQPDSKRDGDKPHDTEVKKPHHSSTSEKAE